MAADLLQTLSNLGISVERVQHKGDHDEYHARCPWHFDGTKEEVHSSWSINSETGAHNCFSCGFGGGLAFLIHKVTGIPYEEAVKQAGTKALAMARVRARDPWAGQEAAPKVPMTEARILMYDDPPEWALEKRRLTHRAAEDFGIRWDTSREAWILPIRDPATAKLIGYQEKGDGKERFFNNVPPGVAKSLTLFGFHLLDPTATTVVVESPLDAALLHALGYQAVATFGASVSDEQMRMLVANSGMLILCFDNPSLDDAGRKATMRVFGRNGKGEPDRFLTDWSKIIEVRLFNHIGLEGSDPGEYDDAQIHNGLKDSMSFIRWQMRGYA